MKKVKLVIVMFLVFASIFSGFATREDCFNELKDYYDFKDMDYNDYRDGFSNSYNIDDPFLRLNFKDPIFSIRFHNMGEDSTLKAGNWPEYKEYNFFEIYVDNPNSFDSQFATCGYMKLIPLGDYSLDSLDSSDFNSQDLSSYRFNIDAENSNFRILETVYDTIDNNEDPFIRWELFRIFDKKDGLYVKQHELINRYKEAFNDYQEGQYDSFIFYEKEIINSGAGFAKHLENYNLYKEITYDSDIDDDVEPFEFIVPKPFVYEFTLGSKVEVDNIDGAIVILNDQLLELKLYGFLGFYSNVISPVSGDLNQFEKINEIESNLETMFNIISRGYMYKPINFTMVDGRKMISKSDVETIEENINTYLSQKICVPGDFVCTAWNSCSGSSSARSVVSNRNCVGINPQKTVSCSWKLHSIGPQYNSGIGCSGTVYRDDVYRDVFNSFIFDVCGGFSTGQWMNHQKTQKTTVGSFDDCGGDDDGGGN